MINLPKTSKKIFIESIVSLVIIVPIIICSIETKGKGFEALGCMILGIPLLFWIAILFILTIKDFIKKSEDRILELIIFISSIFVGYPTISILAVIFLLTIKNRISRNETGDNTKNSGSYFFGVIFSIIGAVAGYYIVQQFNFIYAILLAIFGIILGWKFGYRIGIKKEITPNIGQSKA